MIKNPYQCTTFIKSAATLSGLPPDEGIEVAFVGRSNAGKSSALNALTHHKKLAKTSKTPGRTQLINLFQLDAHRRLVDLPGYGYAKVSATVLENWQILLSDYLSTRCCLRGLVVLMDCRHPFMPLDHVLIDLALRRSLKLHLLLTKADKLSHGALCTQLKKVHATALTYSPQITCQTFSALKKTGLDTFIHTLNTWYGFSDHFL